MQFDIREIPVARSMIALAIQPEHPYQAYFSLWAAFNNIYVLVNERLQAPKHSEGNTDGVKFDEGKNTWGYRFPKYESTSSERDVIKTAVGTLDDDAKHDLIIHDNTHFFVHRRPRGIHSRTDSLGQEINGVLNLTRTININYPVWSPIRRQSYETYIQGDHSAQTELTEQIAIMLYTIRNNLVHGHKSVAEATDVRVVEMALPLLGILVQSFIINHNELANRLTETWRIRHENPR